MAILTTILIILAVIIAVSLLLLLILLLVSFHISAEFCKEGGLFKGILEVRLLKIRIIRRKFPEEKEAKEEKIEKAQKKELKEEPAEPSKKAKWEFKDINRIISLSFESWPQFFRIFLEIWKSIKLEKVNVHLILGLNSPVDTAKTLGNFWAASALINFSHTVNISAEPSFNEEKVDLEGNISFKIRLFRPFMAVLRLLTKKSFLKLLWELRRFR